jgi:hypothetical protein
VKTGPRLRDDMSIHTKPLFLSKRLPGTGERVGTGSVSGSHPAQEVHRRKSLPWTNTRAQEESTDRMLPRKGETRRWRRTSVVARASRVNNMAACTGIQSPAAAMGAGPLGSVTLPVWAQPWYALHNPLVCVVLGVGPKFEPNKFGGVGKKASKQHNSDDRDAKCGSRWSQRRRESRHQATTRSPPARGRVRRSLRGTPLEAHRRPRRAHGSFPWDELRVWDPGD